MTNSISQSHSWEVNRSVDRDEGARILRTSKFIIVYTRSDHSTVS